MGFLGWVLWVFRGVRWIFWRALWVTVPFSADLLEFAPNIGEEDVEEEKPRRPLALAECGKKVTSLVATRPDVVLGGRISNERERKSLKREEGEAEEPEMLTYAMANMNSISNNVFMLIGCSAQSLLFQGFPRKHLPCRNVSGMSCEDYYRSPAWDLVGHKAATAGSMYGSNLPECCVIPFEAIKYIYIYRSPQK
jgi:hypothetical protein